MADKQQEPVKPEEFRAMAEAISRIEQAMKKLKNCGLSTEALVILLHHQSRVPQRDVKMLLNCMDSFGERYLTPQFRAERKRDANV